MSADLLNAREAIHRVFGFDDPAAERKRARALLSRAREGSIVAHVIVMPNNRVRGGDFRETRATPAEVWRADSTDNAGEEIAAIFGHGPPEWSRPGWPRPESSRRSGVYERPATNAERFVRCCVADAGPLLVREREGASYDYWLAFALDDLRAHAPDTEGAAAGQLLRPLRAAAEECPPDAAPLATLCRWALKRCDLSRERERREIAEECARRWPKHFTVRKAGAKGWSLHVPDETGDAGRAFKDELAKLRPPRTS